MLLYSMYLANTNQPGTSDGFELALYSYTMFVMQRGLRIIYNKLNTATIDLEIFILLNFHAERFL